MRVIWDKGQSHGQGAKNQVSEREIEIDNGKLNLIRRVEVYC